MKRLNKVLQSIITTVATVAMALVLVPNAAIAAGSHTITVTANDDSDHSYSAYQVFSGVYDAKTGNLSNIVWGDGVDGTALLDALKRDETLGSDFARCETAKDVANKLESYGDDSAQLKAFATVVGDHLAGNGAALSKTDNTNRTYSVSNVADGYYFIKDAEAVSGQGAATRYILKVVGDVTVTAKSNVPTVEKKVKDTNDSTGKISEWQDSADYDIGDSVPYQITGTMPSNIDDYTTYYYKFTDTMSAGLTYAAKTAKIKIGDTDVTGEFTENVTNNANGTTTVTWECSNLKAISSVKLASDSTVVVSYNATLNDKAVIGAAGNPNEVDLTFSNNPNKNHRGEHGTTPKDKNIVFTYKTVVNKVDQHKKSLKGAAFKLEKKQSDGNYKTVKEFTAGDDTTFAFTGLDDGDYKLTETTTPAGYNTIDPIKFTISAEHDGASDDPKLTDLSGNVTTGEAIFTADKVAGSLTTDVENKKGSVLPSTGGMGTTVLYVAGAAIVVAAGIGLALRRNKRQDA